MNRYFEMFAYERSEKVQLGEFMDFMGSDLDAAVIHRLAVPVDASEGGNDSDGPAPSHQSPQVHSHLLQLPVDIILLITDDLDLNSLYTLSRSCWCLRNLLRPVVSNRFQRTLALWANTPLLCCTQDYVNTNPPGVTTQIPKDFVPDPKVRNNIPPEKYKDPTVIDLIRHLHPIDVLSPHRCISLPTLILSHPPRWMPSHQHRRHLHPWVFAMTLERFSPCGRRWVLRNLTAKEFVYAHVFTSLHGQGGGGDSPVAEHDYGYNFGTLLAVNTCWLAECPWGVDELNVRGRWAGHCFDIVEEAKLLRDMKDADGAWLDVSLREHKAMMRLFECNAILEWGRG